MMTSPAPEIIGIGRSFTDIIADIDDSLLAEFGLKKGIGVPVDAATIEAIIKRLDNPLYMAGGSVANTMSGLAALGLPVTYLGKTADDAAGRFFNEAFEKEGVMNPNAPVSTSEGVSGTCLCLNSPDGERTFAYHIGVCESLSPQDIPAELFSEAQMMILQLLMLETKQCYESVKALLPQLPEHVQKVFCLHDTQDMGKIDQDILDAVDIVVGSRDEVSRTLGIRGEKKIQEMARARDLHVLMTNGAEGAIIFTPQTSFEIASVPPRRIVDTVGAGDHFAAGFLFGLAQEWPMHACAVLAARCASLIIEQPGGRPNAEMRAKLREWGSLEQRSTVA